MIKTKFTKAQVGVTEIKESLTHQAEVTKNRIWYRGDPGELDQFFKKMAVDDVSKTRFWAAVPSKAASIRKAHSGIPAVIVDKLGDIITSDLDGITVDPAEDPDGKGKLVSPGQETWDVIAKDNKFTGPLGLFESALKETLTAGDGAFKLSVDTEITKYPIIEFYSGEDVEFEYKRGRLTAIIFLTSYFYDKKSYILKERYAKNLISYELFESGKDKPLPLRTVPELAELTDYTFKGDFIMAVPLMFIESSIYRKRGASIFHGKTESFDGLDEVVSQWIDAIRAGRVKNYIPEDLIPKDDRGNMLGPNPFDNNFIATGTSMKEGAKDEIKQIQAGIDYTAFAESYAAMLDMSLQGVISPATLGIDIKKTDNAEAQREKEKTTLYTRSKLLDSLNEALSELVKASLNVYENMNKHTVRDHEVSVQFGEYASPDFNEKIEAVGKARSFGIMSLEKAVNELYGDTLTDEEKQEEIDRLRQELNPVDIPGLHIDGLDIDHEESE